MNMILRGVSVKENNDYKFKIGDILVRKNKTDLAEVIDEGYNQYTIKIKKYNTFTLYAYISDYRLATETEILQSKIKNIFIK
jgi:hypothetical protein